MSDSSNLERFMLSRFPSKLYAPGFSFWKKPIIRDFCRGSHVVFCKSLDDVPEGAAVLVWGVRQEEALAVRASNGRRVGAVIRLEDGFVRSVGLGVDLIRPISWVMDRKGIYYDATRPSELEEILQDASFDEDLLQRAESLRERVVASRLTKYNVGGGGWQRPDGAHRVILVTGQVESDASIAYGAPEGICSVRRNMDLLRAVRLDNPGAYVVYKPHPDVIAGLRIQGADENSALQWCDEQVLDVPMGDLLGLVDEVHVMTSLAGFEALLRGKRVCCYGQPFYSGWGLTVDKAPPVERRTRRLSLNELVAGALILYPTYVSLSTRQFTTPEGALDELQALRERGASELPWWRRLLRLVLRYYKH